MGSRCYDDTRLIGCGSGWMRREGGGEKVGKMQKRERTSRITQGTLVLYNEKKRNKENVA
jgi:hypothetical protein